MNKKFNEKNIKLKSDKITIDYINVLVEVIRNKKDKYKYEDFLVLTELLNKWSKSNELILELDKNESKIFYRLSRYAYPEIINKIGLFNPNLSDREINFLNFLDVNNLIDENDFDDILRLPLKKNFITVLFYVLFGIALTAFGIYILYKTHFGNNSALGVSIVLLIIGSLLLFQGTSSIKKKPRVFIFKIKDNILSFYDENNPDDFMIKGEYYLPDLTKIWIYKYLFNFSTMSKQLKGIYKNTEINLLDLTDEVGKIRDDDLNNIVSFIVKHNTTIKIGY